MRDGLIDQCYMVPVVGGDVSKLKAEVEQARDSGALSEETAKKLLTLLRFYMSSSSDADDAEWDVLSP